MRSHRGHWLIGSGLYASHRCRRLRSCVEQYEYLTSNGPGPDPSGPCQLTSSESTTNHEGHHPRSLGFFTVLQAFTRWPVRAGQPRSEEQNMAYRIIPKRPSRPCSVVVNIRDINGPQTLELPPEIVDHPLPGLPDGHLMSPEELMTRQIFTALAALEDTR